MSFNWSHFLTFIQSSMIQYWHSKKALFHFTPQKQWCDLKTSKETTLCINLLSINVWLNIENREAGPHKKSFHAHLSFFKRYQKWSKIAKTLAVRQKTAKNSKTMWYESTEKSHYSLHLFSVGRRLKQRPVGANVNLFSSLLAPNTYLLHRPYSSLPPRGFSSDYRELHLNKEPKILGCCIPFPK